MDKRIASPRFTDDMVAQSLMRFLDEEACPSLGLKDVVFYYDFPLFRDETEHLYKSKVLVATKTHGLVVISPVSESASGSEVSREDELLAQLDSNLYSKFIRSQTLRSSRRSLKFEITPIIYFPEKFSGELPRDLENPTIETLGGLRAVLENQEESALLEHEWEELIAVLEGTKAISKPESRALPESDTDSWAAVIKSLEDKIATFDRDQRGAAITVVDGPQRIRGIAGSGKTIVIAMKAAHLHLTFPEKTILVTFWTKSLYDLLKRQITRFYRQFSDRDPDWSRIRILHAWGGANQEGVYYNTCIENGLRPLTLGEVPKLERSKFSYACEKLLKSAALGQVYDYVLIDEGQDLPSSFYRLCFEICNGGLTDRNIVWAYDELQTIMDSKVQDVHQTFGTLDDGTPRIDLSRAESELSRELMPHDIVLRKSYRNPPELLMMAHALGLGVCSDTPVQTLENRDHWLDLGYEVEEGNCNPGERTVISRPQSNSPLNITENLPLESVIRFQSKPNLGEELDWLIGQILEFLEQGLKPEDILVISLDDRHATDYFKGLASRLLSKDIKFNNIHAKRVSVPKVFIEGHITFSTIYKAKGNEAPVVLICGVDAVAPYLDDVKVRNRIFTAVTRSKGFLRASGMGKYADQVFTEMRMALASFPKLIFNYPDPEKIQMIQRDLNSKSQKIRETLDRLREEMGDDISDEDLFDLVKTTGKKSE